MVRKSGNRPGTKHTNTPHCKLIDTCIYILFALTVNHLCMENSILFSSAQTFLF